MKNLAKVLFGWMAVFLTCTYAIDVTITSHVPIEHLDATGQVDGATMSNVGDKYPFQRFDSGKVYLTDPKGGFLVIELDATDYRPPVVATPRPAPVASVISPVSPVPTAAPNQPFALTDNASMVDKVNQALGIPLFSQDKSLWDEDAGTVGQRIGWTADSITSFRKYDDRPALRMHMQDDPSDHPDPTIATIGTTQTDPSVTADLLGRPLANCLGCHAYCSTLYTRHGKPDFLSIIFANNGDIALAAKDINLDQAQTTPIIVRDAKYLEKVLTQTFGDFTESGFGASTIRAPAKRWDWNGTSVLLIHSAARYVGVIICPTDFADGHGVRPDRDSNALRAGLVDNLKKSDNGDVYIDNIPYVDQGEKGYCVPATWERYLRYLDIPSDMYFFANAGDTGFGGGTNIDVIRNSLAEYLDSYQTHAMAYKGQVTMDMVVKAVNTGRPLMWSCWFTDDIEKDMFSRGSIRNDKSWDTYVAQEKLDIGKVKNITVEHADNGHMRLIVGYNLQTNEVAISDTWRFGKFYWMGLEEAQAENMGDITVLQ